MQFEAPEPMERRKTGHHMIDMITSICALCISAISIFMAYDNGHDMQKLVHASSWPALRLRTGNAGDGHEPALEFGVQNAGVGPARVHTFEFLVDGVVVDKGWKLGGIVEACCGEALKKAMARAKGSDRAAFGGDGNEPVANSFLPPRETAIAVRWPRSEQNQELWRVVDEARVQGRITMRTCYCSVFDECWVAQTKVFPPRPVNACPPSR